MVADRDKTALTALSPADQIFVAEYLTNGFTGATWETAGDACTEPSQINDSTGSYQEEDHARGGYRDAGV